MRRLTYVTLVVSLLLSLVFVVSVSAGPARADRGAWAPGMALAVNDTVTYGGCTYKVLQAHTTQIGWEPPTTPALFSLVSCGTSPSNTPTRTNPPGGPTATRTRTPTRTNTPSGPTNTPTRTPTAGSTGTCAVAWSAIPAYVAGNIVSDAGRNYKANWWNQNDRPSTSTSGAWTSQGTCTGTPPTATNTAGPSPTPTNPTSVNAGPGVPNKVFAPYVDTGAWPTFSVVNTANSTGHKYYTLAFVLSGGGCVAKWNGVTAMGDYFYAGEINTLRAMGGDVIVSFGGANGTELAQACGDVASLQAAYQSVITQYKLSRIDFDIEGGATTDSASIDRRNKAIKGLQAANPSLKIAFCLPVMPTGLIQSGLDIISNAKANAVRIDVVNVMAMDYGGANNAMGQAAINAATNTHNQMSGMGVSATIGVTPMIGQNDSQGEIFTLSDASSLLSFAQSNTWIGMIAFWSMGRDNGGCPGQTYASPTCSGVSQSLFQYANTFKAFK